MRINFRARLDGAQNLLLCLEEGSLVQRAEGKWMQVEAELTSVLDSIQTGTIVLDADRAHPFLQCAVRAVFRHGARQLQSLERSRAWRHWWCLAFALLKISPRRGNRSRQAREFRGTTNWK